MSRIILGVVCFLLITGYAHSSDSSDEPLKAFRLLSLSVADELAVVKHGERMLPLNLGDALLDGRYTFSKIKADSIVLADELHPGDTVVLFVSKNGNPSRIQRISPQVPEQLKKPQAAYQVEVH